MAGVCVCVCVCVVREREFVCVHVFGELSRLVVQAYEQLGSRGRGGRLPAYQQRLQ